jgi:hypothetical protein
MNTNTIDSVININDIENFEKLKDTSKRFIKSNDEPTRINIDEKNQALSIVYDGYTTLPIVYHELFLDPLIKLLQNENYSDIKDMFSDDGKELYGSAFYDWLSSIHQRRENYLSSATNAFEELVADIYDGYLSNSSRRGIKPPDHMLLSPLVNWSSEGPYTWPVEVGKAFNMKMSLVTMPKMYSENIALWSANGHEVAGHDVLHADEGLLGELEGLISEKIIENKNENELVDRIYWNGNESISVAEFAAKYWRYTIDEAAADICGLLNLGPAAAISYAIIAIVSNDNVLDSTSYIDNVHPIDTLRVFMASEVIKLFEELDLKVRNSYVDFFDNLVEKYANNKDECTLYSTLLDGRKNKDVNIPLKGMKKTVEIVAKTIAFTNLNTLENHSLSEINTWSNRDQILVQRISDDLLEDKKEISLDMGPDYQEVFASHIVAGATIALTKKSDITSITEKAIQSLNELHKSNPVWKNFPARFRTDAYKHNLISSRSKKSTDNRTNEERTSKATLT